MQLFGPTSHRDLRDTSRHTSFSSRVAESSILSTSRSLLPPQLSTVRSMQYIEVPQGLEKHICFSAGPFGLCKLSGFTKLGQNRKGGWCILPSDEAALMLLKAISVCLSSYPSLSWSNMQDVETCVSHDGLVPSFRLHTQAVPTPFSPPPQCTPNVFRCGVMVNPRQGQQQHHHPSSQSAPLFVSYVNKQ